MALNLSGSNGVSGVDGSASTPALQGSDSNTGIHFPAADTVAIDTGGSERVRCDSSGRLLVGTSTSMSAGGQAQYAKFQIIGSTASATGQGIISIGRGQAASSGIASGNDVGYINFTDSAGNEFAQIGCLTDATTGSSDFPGRLTFSVTRDGQSSPSETMRIRNGGGIQTYTTTADDCLAISSQEVATTGTALIYGLRSATGVGTGTIVFSVTTNGNVYNTNGTYTTLSDKRLKENIVDAGSQWQDIKSIDIRKFNFRQETGNETHTQIGPIAQELEAVCPGLVIEREYKGDEGLTDSDGNPITSVKYVNQSVLYMKAVKALQEAMERIETLETRLNALEVQP